MDEGNENLVYVSPWDFKSAFACHKILRYGTSSLFPIRKKDVLWTFIALKIPLPWPGLNLQPMGLVACTLTTAPPRRLL
jgi:hypothetical protein